MNKKNPDEVCYRNVIVHNKFWAMSDEPENQVSFELFQIIKCFENRDAKYSETLFPGKLFSLVKFGSFSCCSVLIIFSGFFSHIWTIILFFFFLWIGPKALEIDQILIIKICYSSVGDQSCLIVVGESSELVYLSYQTR